MALIVSFTFLLSTGCSTSTVNPSYNSENRVTAKVIKVIDGDTIKVSYNGKIETVRFLLVDTPETHHPKLGVQPYGPEASEFTHHLLDGGTVQLELAVNNGRDKYGRVLAYIFHHGQSVEDELLSHGLARVAYIYPPNTKYLSEYRAAEQRAKNKKLNIWSVSGYAQSDGFHPELMKDKGTKSTSTGSFNPDADGGCTGAIKGNITSKGSKIYHIPSDPYYKITKAEACFKTVKAATTAGFRAPR